MLRRMSLQYRNSVLSQWFVYEWIKRFKNGRTNINHEQETGHPLLMQTQNEPVTWSCRIDGWVFMKWHINCKLVLVQPMKLSITGLPFIKPVHDGSQSNSQNCTKWNVWTSANGFWIAMVLQVTASWKESSWEMKRGSTILSQRVNREGLKNPMLINQSNTRVWNGKILIRPPSKSSNCNRRRAYAYRFWDTSASTGKLSRDGFNSEQCSLQWDAVWQAKACNLKQMIRPTVRGRCVVAHPLP